MISACHFSEIFSQAWFFIRSLKRILWTVRWRSSYFIHYSTLLDFQKIHCGDAVFTVCLSSRHLHMPPNLRTFPFLFLQEKLSWYKNTFDKSCPERNPIFCGHCWIYICITHYGNVLFVDIHLRKCPSLWQTPTRGSVKLELRKFAQELVMESS